MLSPRAGLHEVHSNNACDERRTLPWFKRWRVALVDRPTYSFYDRWRVLLHQLEGGWNLINVNILCHSLLYSITSVFSLYVVVVSFIVQACVYKCYISIYTSLSCGVRTYVRTYMCTCDRCCLFLGCSPGHLVWMSGCLWSHNWNRHWTTCVN